MTQNLALAREPRPDVLGNTISTGSASPSSFSNLGSAFGLFNQGQESGLFDLFGSGGGGSGAVDLDFGDFI